MGSNNGFLEAAYKEAEKGNLPPQFLEYLVEFYSTYRKAIEKRGWSMDQVMPYLNDYLAHILKNVASPHRFEPFHRRVTKPYDYTHFALEMIRSLILYEESKVIGYSVVNKMCEQLDRKENVIVFANHQTEPDPQVIQLLLKDKFPQVLDMTFVAGDRVVTDPLAIPFSMGCNLLCIYSKKHIENPPELKEEKQKHNQKTMLTMSQLLREGGMWIYVAPSGGRDRTDEQGNISVAPFDPQSVEMFALMARQAKTPTHFYPLALSTYDLLPPPQSVDKEIGEKREPSCCPVQLAFGEEVDLEAVPGMDDPDKKVRRQKRADYLWNIVCENYRRIT